jgi:translocation and assembly module TamB
LKWRRIFRAGIGLLWLLVVLAGAALTWLYATESGARFLVGRAIGASGGRLGVAGVTGRLSDELVLTDVRFRDASAELDIDRLSLSFDATALLRGVLDVEELHSSIVRYRWMEETATDGRGAAARVPSLPLGLRVSRATVEGVSAKLGADRELTLERITLSAAAEDTTASIQRFETRWRGFFLSLQGRLSWTDGFSVDGLVSWSGTLRGRQWLGSANVDGRWPVFAVDEELLEPFSQSATGTVDLSGDPAADLQVALAGVGSAAVTGRLDTARSTVLATVTARDLTPAGLWPGWPGRWSADGRFSTELGAAIRIESDNLNVAAELDGRRLGIEFAGALDVPSRLSIDRLEMTLGANHVSLSGRAGESLDLAVAADLDDLSALGALAARDEMQALGPAAALAVALNGRATADLTVTGDRRAPRVAGDLRLEQSSFADLPLELALDFATPGADEPSIAIERLDATLGASQVTGTGTIGSAVLSRGDGRAAEATLDLMLEARLGDLGELAALAARDDVRALVGAEPELAGLGGQAVASVALTGTLERPHVSGDLRATNLSIGKVSLPAARLGADLGVYAGGPANLRLTVTTDAWSARLLADGAIGAGVWSGTLRSLELDERELGTWSLSAPVALAVGPGRMDLARTCLARAASSVCVEWRHGERSDRLRLAADDFELPLLNPLLPETVALTGRMSFDARLDTPGGIPAGRVSASGSGIGINVAVSETDRVTTTLESLTLDATLEDYALALDARIESGTRGRAEVRMSSSDVRDRTAPISGRFDIVWPDLAALSLLSPDIGEVGGTLAVSIDVAGTADDPALSGKASLDDGHVAVPEFGLLIDRVEAQATSFDGGSLQFSGSGYVQDSEIRLNGVTELDPEAGWPTHLSLEGDDIPVSRRPDATIFASPDFDVDIDLPRIAVEGRVLVPRADIAVEELPTQAVRVSSDAVVHGRPESEPIRPLDVTADVTVELGDAVHYAGSNLSADLSGSLRLEYESGLSPIASGSLTLDGSYDAYGQSLALQRGELLFAGPLNDPAIDVLAVREIGSTTVGVRMNGTLLMPRVSIFSDPQMSEANALSYLMFGRPISASEGTERATLQSAALSLGLQQALPVVQRVGETLGLDELSIETTDLDAGALMAGKYLSPKVYMSYSYGLFNRLGGFLLRYQINDRFSLETRSGSEKSMDLLYSIEKD